ncbi:uncharacterized protein BDZ83DRAFT_616444 [Colletotrichum acutatum]|uniref:Secreted protein n=1 Tax=Glomerella acutata TaxID=27357 RepID=A0AAD8US97_GLOAC|nr:uncharacterized protein BDZ83DRAFT_616444 [Colletotrichum acutatum]KAK1726371.1 hypothetical protein BDZ83DRAFT_616444 [Colletotrichum acutatum]
MTLSSYSLLTILISTLVTASIPYSVTPDSRSLDREWTRRRSRYAQIDTNQRHYAITNIPLSCELRQCLPGPSPLTRPSL